MRRQRVVQFAVLAIALSSAAYAGDGIVPVRENGRTIFVNNDAPAVEAKSPSANAAVDTRQLVYWSHTEHRWKRVPKPSAAALRNAETAAQEVSQLVANAPRANDSTTSAGNSRTMTNSAPDTRALTHGRAISQEAMDAAIVAAAARHNVDVNLVRSIIKVESNFNPHAVSRKGAIGLMQLMPATARQLNVRNPYDPEQNVDGGVRHFKSLLDNFGGDVQLSLAAYNAGQGAVERKGGVPNFKETRDYVKRITELSGYNNPFAKYPGAYRGPAANPIHTSRDSAGHLMFTNE